MITDNTKTKETYLQSQPNFRDLGGIITKSGKFIKQYVELGIYKRDPFESLDQEGVGELMKIAIRNLLV